MPPAKIPPQTVETAETASLSQRFDDMTAEYYSAQANYHDSKSRFAALEKTHQTLRLSYDALRATLEVKQRVITVLLQFYPYPLSPELRYDINLA